MEKKRIYVTEDLVYRLPGEGEKVAIGIISNDRAKMKDVVTGQVYPKDCKVGGLSSLTKESFGYKDLYRHFAFNGCGVIDVFRLAKLENMLKKEFFTIGQIADMENLMNKLWASDMKRGDKRAEVRKLAEVTEEEREF